MRGGWRGSAIAARVMGAALATALMPAEAMASYFASGFLESGLGSCGNPIGAPAQSSSVAAQWNSSHSGPGCSMQGSASASPGHVTSLSSALLDTGDGASGSIRSAAGASFGESSLPFAVVGIPNIVSLRLHAQINVSGSASAEFGAGPTGVSASTRYFYQWFDQFGTGTRAQTAGVGGATTSETGQWGTIDLFADVTMLLIALDTVLPTISLSMSAGTDASVGKLFVPGEQATGLATADFSHTLLWGGIVGVQAFDANHDEIALPSDFRLSLIGADTGFDYWNSALVSDVSDVPEPATLALLGLGLAGLRATRRRPVA